MRRLYGTALALLAAVALGGCNERTYVVLSVSVDPALQPQTAQLRVVGRLMLGGAQLTASEELYPDPAGSAPLSFPASFIVKADGRGHDGESLQTLVELLDASGATVGRARGEVAIQYGKQATLELLVRAPCATVDDCLAGGTFCTRPQRCVCESTASCAEGTCEPLTLDDSNECTTDGCDEGSRTVTHVAVADGTTCQPFGSSSASIQCVAGLCACGDGITNPAIEECDEGAANANDSNRCRIDPPCTLPRCGDGIWDDATPFNEECDEGAANSNAPDASCRTNCRVRRCGDGTIDPGADEQCDNGDDCTTGRCNNNSDKDGCRVATPEHPDWGCKVHFCGDGVVDSDEECDDGTDCSTGKCNDDSKPLACRTNCKKPSCGDGVVDVGVAFETTYTERCDPASATNGPGCNPTCTLKAEVSFVAGGVGGPGHVDGLGNLARLGGLWGLVVVGGDAYFTTGEDAFEEAQTVRRVTLADGTVRTVAGTPGQSGAGDGAGQAARFARPRGLAAAGGYLFVADSGNHRVRRIALATGAVDTVAGTSMGTADGSIATAQLAQPQLIAARSATELYVVDTLLSEPCLVRKIDLQTGQVSTVAGSKTPPFNKCQYVLADGTGGSAKFYDPRGLALSPDGTALYVADYNVIRKVDLATGGVTTVAGEAFTEDWQDGFGLGAYFGVLDGIAASSDALYIADAGNQVIRKLDLATTEVTTVVGSHGVSGDTDSPPLFNEPRAIAVTSAGLVIGEAWSYVVRTVALPGLATTTLAGRREEKGLVNGAAADARFGSLDGLVTDGAKVWVADEQNRRVRLVDLSAPVDVATLVQAPALGVFDLGLVGARLFGVYAGQLVYELDPSTGQPIGAPVALQSGGTPRSVAALGDSLYVADPFLSVIHRVKLADGTTSIFAGYAHIANVTDGPLAEALFDAPTAIVACHGDLFVAEGQTTVLGNVVRRISMSTAMVTTLAGAPGLVGARDGDGILARFDDPQGLACDGHSLYVADSGNHLVRQIVIDTGSVSTLAGVAHEAGSIDGTGTAARFNCPQGIAFDPVGGDLYVGDRNEHVLRRIH